MFVCKNFSLNFLSLDILVYVTREDNKAELGDKDGYKWVMRQI